MEDIKILESVERYILGKMKPDERVYFEQLRKSNVDIDQLIVEHTLFLHKMNELAELKSYKTSLNEVHTDLSEKGNINSEKLKGKAKVVYLWKRYKRVTAIAASIAGITTLTVSAFLNVLAPKADNVKVQELGVKVERLENNNRVIHQQLIDVRSDIKSKIAPGVEFKGGGTGFLVDPKGYLVTNAHILKNGDNIIVLNSKGDQFKAFIAKIDFEKDIAILKINDKDFKGTFSIPYGIKKRSTDIAEPIFTLGYPRNEIVYGEGYLSAKTGFKGDTLNFQIGIAANPGNSGGPVFNNNGEVIGILSTKELQVEGVAFAIQSKFIFNAIAELRKDSAHHSVTLPLKSKISSLNHTQQVKKISEYVYMIRSY
ncbi:MAG TPA: serine protease [Chitinophagaceae bacterium]|nr:serine protease [Chitinophagaceae bacterium]